MGLTSRGSAGLLLAIFAPFAFSQDFLSDAPNVQAITSNGVILGSQLTEVQAFRSIPYAAAPIGARRFRPPAAPMHWKSARLAREAGPACPQILDNEDAAEDGDQVMSEDCLTVNVWTPAADAKARPVMVFIHGGGLVDGSAADSWYDGAALARRGDAVVITLQYRLGVFGFLELADIGGADYAQSGNLGILDQIAALEWVRANAAHFGGDPNNVTLFGESAGGASVRGLMAIPRAKNLFHKVIIESADPGQFVALDAALDVARQFRLLTGAPSIAQLKQLSMQDMLRGQARLWAKGFDAALASMVNDGVVFRSTPIEQLAADAGASKPMIIGTNAEEMHYFDALEDQAQIFSLSEAQMRDRLTHLFGAAGASILEVYQKQNLGWHETLSELAGDAVFLMPSVRAAELNASRQPTYMYLFSYRSPTLGPTGKQYGALHGLEVAFVFRLATSKGYTYVGPKGSWQRLSDQMSDAWIRFARTGNPNGEGLPAWPTYDAQNRFTMDFNLRSEVLLDPKSAQRRAWAAIESKRFENGEVVHLGD